MAGGEQLDSAPRPNRPVPKQTPDDAPSDYSAIANETERRQQVEHDLIVITGIQGHVLSPGVDNSPNHVQCLIAVEGRDLDRRDDIEFEEAPPEGVRQHAAANGRLEIEADERHDPAQDTAMLEQSILVGILER